MSRRTHLPIVSGGEPSPSAVEGVPQRRPESFPTDQRGRPLADLRISVTDRCNFRCGYCMPKEIFGPGFRFLPKPQILTFEEITRLAHIFVEQGVTKLRLTGGEPLLRSELHKLVHMLAALDVDLALTTNGSLLDKNAQRLADAGLRRVTVSLDSLNDATFRRMNDVDFPVSAVLHGIDAALGAGLPVKVNSVIQRGVNDGDIVELAEHFRGTGVTLRFIEFMDVGSSNGWNESGVVSGSEIVERIGRRAPLEPIGRQRRGDVANRYRYLDGRGELGIIPSVTQPFCGDCTRARLSADGKLYTCLFARQGYDLASPLRSGASDEWLAAAIGGIWLARNDRYSELRGERQQSTEKVEMSYIGG